MNAAYRQSSFNFEKFWRDMTASAELGEITPRSFDQKDLLEWAYDHVVRGALSLDTAFGFEKALAAGEARKDRREHGL